MDKIRKKLEKLRFRLLLLPADNHSEVPVTVIGFRKGVIYFGVILMVTLLISFFVFRFTPFNTLVDVKAELSDQDLATIQNLNKRVTVLASELNKIRLENERMKFLLTLTDSTNGKQTDSVKVPPVLKKNGKNKQIK